MASPRHLIPGFGATDPFRGLRDLPRNLEQLRHHLSSIHHTLQSSYFVDADTAHFVLQPEKTEELYHRYTEEVEKIFQHLSKATRRRIKVRVNPQRHRKGYEITPSSQLFSPSDIDGIVSKPEDPEWVAQLEALGRKLQDAEKLKSFRESTPEAHPPPASALDSDARVHKNSHLFSTPPEFKGFTVSMDVSGSP